MAQSRISRISLFSIAIAAASAAALSLPATASAEYLHPASGEASFIVHPEHFNSTRTRAQVAAEAAAAVQAGSLASGNRAYPPTRLTSSTKTRQQVIEELRNETPAERAARRTLYRH